MSGAIHDLLSREYGSELYAVNDSYELLNAIDQTEGEKLIERYAKAVHPGKDVLQDAHPNLAHIYNKRRLVRGKPIGLVQASGITSSLRCILDRYGHSNFDSVLKSGKYNAAQRRAVKREVRRSMEEVADYLVSEKAASGVFNDVQMEVANIATVLNKALKAALDSRLRNAHADMYSKGGMINLDFAESYLGEVFSQGANIGLVYGELTRYFGRALPTTNFFTKQQIKVKPETPLKKLQEVIEKYVEGDEKLEAKIRDFYQNHSRKAHQPVSSVEKCVNALLSKAVMYSSYALVHGMPGYFVYAGGVGCSPWTTWAQLDLPDKFRALALDLEQCDASHFRESWQASIYFLQKLTAKLCNADPDVEVMMSRMGELLLTIFEEWQSESMDGLFKASTCSEMTSGAEVTHLFNSLLALIVYHRCLPREVWPDIIRCSTGGDDGACIFPPGYDPRFDPTWAASVGVVVKIEALTDDYVNLHSMNFDSRGVYPLPSKIAAKFMGALFPPDEVEATQLFLERREALVDVFRTYWYDLDPISRACAYATHLTTLDTNQQFMCVQSCAWLIEVDPLTYIRQLPVRELRVDSQLV